MKSNLLKFLVILSAVLFIGTGVSWADGNREKGHQGYRGNGNHYQKWHNDGHHSRDHKNHSYSQYREPNRYYGHPPRFKYQPPKHHYRHGLKQKPYRHGYHKEQYAFMFSIIDPDVAFGFSVKAHK